MVNSKVDKICYTDIVRNNSNCQNLIKIFVLLSTHTTKIHDLERIENKSVVDIMCRIVHLFEIRLHTAEARSF